MTQASTPTRLPDSSPGNRDTHALPSIPPRCFDTFHCPKPFPWTYRGSLPELRLAYELSGPIGAPLVVALGGISASSHVVATPQDPSPGWWQALVGVDRAVDPRHLRVLSFDYLGGNGESSGPRNSTEDFSAVDTHDQAHALVRLLDHLGESQVDLFLGASYGGMVALAFAADFPERLGQAVVIGAADRPHPRSTAWRVVQRRIVQLALSRGAGDEGLALSRALAMTTYRSPAELARRFGGDPKPTSEGAFRFPVETYLDARGDAFARDFDPQAFLGLSQSIDLHRVDPARVSAPVTLVGATSDALVPVQQLRQLAARLAHPGHLVEIDSIYGHDAFLKEGEILGDIVRTALRAGGSI